MKALKATGMVQPDHKVVLQLPRDITPGEHVFIVLVEEGPEKASLAWPTGFLAHFSGALADTDLEAPEDPLPELEDTF